MKYFVSKKFLLGCSGLVLATFVVCSFAFAWWVNHTEYVGYASPDFCTQHDELYQTINGKVQDWLRELPNSAIPVISFSTPNGNKYVANGEMLVGKDPYLYVSIQKTYNQGAMGIRGYMYAVEDKLPDFYTSSIKLTYVGGKIYCYEFK